LLAAAYVEALDALAAPGRPEDDLAAEGALGAGCYGLRMDDKLKKIVAELDEPIPLGPDMAEQESDNEVRSGNWPVASSRTPKRSRMTIEELRPYSGFRVAVTVRSGLVYPGVLHVDGDVVRILQPIPPDFTVLEAEDVVFIEHRNDFGWPVTNASPEETAAAAALLQPYLDHRAALTYDDARAEIGVVSIRADHGWVLLPGTVQNRDYGVVIDLAALRHVRGAS
jgi:hypothetical protein